MGYTTGHNSLSPFDDTLVLWWFSDAGTCCENAQRLLFRDCLISEPNRDYRNWSHLSLNISLK